MPTEGSAWREVLDGYANFLRDKDLVPAPQRPYLVRRVGEFLTFARGS